MHVRVSSQILSFGHNSSKAKYHGWRIVYWTWRLRELRRQLNGLWHIFMYTLSTLVIVNSHVSEFVSLPFSWNNQHLIRETQVRSLFPVKPNESCATAISEICAIQNLLYQTIKKNYLDTNSEQKQLPQTTNTHLPKSGHFSLLISGTTPVPHFLKDASPIHSTHNSFTTEPQPFVQHVYAHKSRRQALHFHFQFTHKN